MQDKEFFYAKGDDKIGPRSLEELKTLKLGGDTLIWYDGIDKWTEIKAIPELYKSLNIKSSPPPLPKRGDHAIKTEVSGEMKVHIENNKNEPLERMKPSKSALRIFLIWSCIHLFALITSYSQIDFFNAGAPRTDKFWPFVEIFEKNRIIERNFSSSGIGYGPIKEKWDYNGLFYRYDWSEFLVFVGGSFFIFIISRLSNQNEQNQGKLE